LAVRIISGLTDGIVGHDIKDKVLRAVVSELVGLSGRENEGVARFDWIRAVLMPDEAGSGDNMVKFPLGAV
jgi:hypothetical protein